MKKLITSAAVVGLSAAALATVYDVKFTAKALQDGKIKSVTIQGAFDDQSNASYFWYKKDKAPINGASFGAKLNQTQAGNKLLANAELVWDDAKSAFVVGASGTSSLSGNFGGMIKNVPAFGTYSFKKSSKGTRNGIQSIVPYGVNAAEQIGASGREQQIKDAIAEAQKTLKEAADDAIKQAQDDAAAKIAAAEQNVKDAEAKLEFCNKNHADYDQLKKDLDAAKDEVKKLTDDAEQLKKDAEDAVAAGEYATAIIASIKTLNKESLEEIEQGFRDYRKELQAIVDGRYDVLTNGSMKASQLASAVQAAQDALDAQDEKIEALKAEQAKLQEDQDYFTSVRTKVDQSATLANLDAEMLTLTNNVPPVGFGIIAKRQAWAKFYTLYSDNYVTNKAGGFLIQNFTDLADTFAALRATYPQLVLPKNATDADIIYDFFCSTSADDTYASLLAKFGAPDGTAVGEPFDPNEAGYTVADLKNIRQLEKLVADTERKIAEMEAKVNLNFAEWESVWDRWGAPKPKWQDLYADEKEWYTEDYVFGVNAWKADQLAQLKEKLETRKANLEKAKADAAAIVAASDLTGKEADLKALRDKVLNQLYKVVDGTETALVSQNPDVLAVADWFTKQTAAITKKANEVTQATTDRGPLATALANAETANDNLWVDIDQDGVEEPWDGEDFGQAWNSYPALDADYDYKTIAPADSIFDQGTVPLRDAMRTTAESNYDAAIDELLGNLSMSAEQAAELIKTIDEVLEAIKVELETK